MKSPLKEHFPDLGPSERLVTPECRVTKYIRSLKKDLRIWKH